MGQEIIGVYCESYKQSMYAEVKWVLIRQFSQEPVTDFGDLMGVILANSPAIAHKSQIPERTIFTHRHIQRVVNAYLSIPLMSHFTQQKRDLLQHELERFLAYTMGLCHYPRASERVLYTDEKQLDKDAIALLDALTGDIMRSCSLAELDQASRKHHTMFSSYLNLAATIVDDKTKSSSKRPPYNRRVHLVEEYQASGMGGQQVEDQHLQNFDSNDTPAPENAVVGAIGRPQTSQAQPAKAQDKNKQFFCILCKKPGHATTRCRQRPAGAGDNNTCYTCGGIGHRSADHHITKIKQIPPSNGVCTNCRGAKHQENSCPSHYVRYVDYEPDFLPDKTAAPGT